MKLITTYVTHSRHGVSYRSGIQEISVPHYSRNIGAPLDATRFLNWVSKDVTLRRKRDAITGTASYYDSWRKPRMRQ